MIEERYRGGACCDDLVAALGEDALAAREAGALLAFERDRADQRAVVQAGAVCGEALAVELGEQRRFARCEGAAAGGEGENKGNRYQAHGGRVAGTRRAGERSCVGETKERLLCLDWWQTFPIIWHWVKRPP